MFSHQSNIRSKIDSNYKGEGAFLGEFQRRYYSRWNAENMRIRGVSKPHVVERVRLLNWYFNKVDEVNTTNKPRGKRNNWITFQSKFRPSVLEEFCYYLLKDIQEIESLGLAFKKKKIHSGFEITSRGEIKAREKDVDCCIVKAANARIDDKSMELFIPVIAIECKTYLDGTMWNEAQYSAMLLKRVNSSAKVYVLTESNQVRMSKISQDSPVNDIFVIRKNSSPVSVEAVLSFLQQIRRDLMLLVNPSVVKIPGRLINF